MMFDIQFDKSFEKTFLKLDKKIQKDILKYIKNEELLKNPKKFGKPLLFERKGNWRYRIGDYRVICKIKDKELVILFLDIGHRKEIYG